VADYLSLVGRVAPVTDVKDRLKIWVSCWQVLRDVWSSMWRHYILLRAAV